MFHEIYFSAFFLVNDDQVILCQGWDGCHLWGERQPCLRPTMCGGRGEQTSFQSKCLWQFSIKMSLEIFNQIFNQSVPGKQAGKSFCTSPPRARAGRQTSLLMHIGTQLATRPQGFGVWSRFGSGVSKSQIWSTKKSQGNVERIEEMLMWSFNDRLQGKVGKLKKIKTKNKIVKIRLAN